MNPVLNGFKRLSDDEKEVLIHDGARPLVTEEIIASVTMALNDYSAAACGVRVKDTLKQVDESGKIIKTIDRSSVFAVQTPQGVKKEEYLSNEIVSKYLSLKEEVNNLLNTLQEIINDNL